MTTLPVTSSTKRATYTAMVGTAMKYPSTDWDPVRLKHIQLLEQVHSQATRYVSQVINKNKNQRKIVNIFLPINFNIRFGCPKEPSFQTVLLSTHNICFGSKIRKIKFSLRTLN